jgi:hypothetical protein
VSTSTTTLIRGGDPAPSWFPTGIRALYDTERALVIVNAFPLRDMNVHSYRTNPSYISIAPMLKRYDEYAVWVYNGTNQTVNAQVIGNVTNDQSYPDYAIGQQETLSAGAANIYVFSAEFAFTPFVSAQISAASAPSSGSVYAVVIVE